MSNYVAKNMTDTKIMTGKVRVAFEHLLEPVDLNGGDNKKYRCCIIIPKSDTKCLEVIQKAVDNAVKNGIEKFGKGFKSAKTALPLHDGDLEKEDDENFKDCYYMNIANNLKPEIVGPDRRHIDDPCEVYSGMWARFTINMYPYSRAGNVGISASLQNVQKLEDDEPLGGRRTSAASDFGEPEDDDFLN